jgi:PTH1 family peptidyl-tRNA hydrolase
MKLIVWLGNPGKKYENTRHSVGFLCVDFLQKGLGGSEWQDSRFQGCISKLEWGSNSTILIKPMTYMNLSGDAVAALTNFYKIPPEDILVISDDIDMDFAKIRYRQKWSHGGQNWLRDIIEKLGTDTFSRIKIGIGRDIRYEVVDWVLSKFSSDELRQLQEEVFPSIEERVKQWMVS